jgi:hypothetical protein
MPDTFTADIRDHTTWSKELDTLCERLETAGYRIQGTRLDSYRVTFATISQFIRENRVHELPNKVPISTLINDLHESHELCEACLDFPDLNFPGLRDRLGKALEGAPQLEMETAAKGKPRNFLFELVMAGLLKRAGLSIRLDRGEDVSFEFRNVPVRDETAKNRAEQC